MHVPPTDLSDAELRTALIAGWRIEPSSIAYAPVGFGSDHWTVVESASRRWFVTADQIADSSTRLADLRAALMAADHTVWVVTHGEPKINNILITSNGPVMIDWDTVRLAPPARDLWMTGGHERYAEQMITHQFGLDQHHTEG
jgi:aminoglycoside phosphotransferase (APT) family kinase protein